MALFGNKNKENVNDVSLQEKIEEERKQKIKLRRISIFRAFSLVARVL